MAAEFGRKTNTEGASNSSAYFPITLSTFYIFSNNIPNIKIILGINPPCNPSPFPL
jgi:hypothetical protein